VTVPSQNGRIRRRGIRVHRSGRLAAEEVVVRNGIPVTTVARTLLDLADVLDRQALRRVITEAEYRQRFNPTSLNAVVQNNPGRRGRKVMEAVEGSRKKDRVLWRAGLRTMRLTDDALDAEEEVLFDLAQAGVSVDSWPRASSYSPPSRPRISSASAM
jgi:hypothetical protein